MTAREETEGRAAGDAPARRRRGLASSWRCCRSCSLPPLPRRFTSSCSPGEDASDIPSALIGKPAPQFDLPPIAGLTKDGSPLPGLSTADLKGHLSLVNVWASWCVPCREEQPLLMQLAADERFRLLGINYKDKPENAKAFLDEMGNPFHAVGADRSGDVGIEWGVYGVPETYLVSTDGTILYKRVGPFTPDAIRNDLMPKIEKALKAR